MLRAYCLLILAAFIWATNFIIGRFLHGQIGPFEISFWRWVIALAVLSPFVWKELKQTLPSLKGYWLKMTILAFLGVTLSTTLIYLGLQYTTALDAGIISAFMPIIIMLFSFFLLKEKSPILQVIGAILALIGTLIIITDGQLDALLHLALMNMGNVIILVSTATWALYTVLIKKYKVPGSASLLLYLTGIIGLIIITPATFAESIYAPPFWSVLTPKVIACLIFLGLATSLITFWAWSVGVKQVGPNKAGYFMFLISFFSAVLAVLFLHEQIHVYHIVGMTLIFGGVVLALAKREKIDLTQTHRH